MEATLIDGNYQIEIHKTRPHTFTLLGKTITKDIPDEIPWFVDTFPVKDSKINIEGTDVPIFNNPDLNLFFYLRVIFMGKLNDGSYVIGKRQREASDPSWYK